VTSAQTRTTTQSFFDDLGRAVQANPVPAALIGMGALWMLMGGGRTTGAAALLSGGASRVADTLAPAASAVGSGVSRLADGVSDLAAGAKEGVSDLATSAKDSVSEFASGARDIAGRAFDAAGEAAADGAKDLTSTAGRAGSQLSQQAGSVGQSATAFAETIQGNLAQTFERQPLLVGVIGLAIGAAIAGAFRKTRFEEEMIGDRAAVLKDNVETLVSEQAENVAGIANRAVDAVKQEAEAQGLTPSALKEGVAAIGKKAAAAAKGVRRNGGQQGLS
jgi:X-X-X-Leu-X-X-Gly heptad repeat protein